jgi:hypothetical protein
MEVCVCPPRCCYEAKLLTLLGHNSVLTYSPMLLAVMKSFGVDDETAV